MLSGRFDSTGLNIAATQKIEFWRGLHNFNQTFILGTRGVSVNCKSALPGIHKALGSKARMGAIVGNFKSILSRIYMDDLLTYRTLLLVL